MTPEVRFQDPSDTCLERIADIAQLVEHEVANFKVAGSSPVVRFQI